EIGGEAATTGAVLDRIFESVVFDRVSSRVPGRRQAPPTLHVVTNAGDLPTANQLLGNTLGAAEKFLSPADRQLGCKIPADLVFRRVGIALIVQEPVAVVEVRGNRAG